MIILIPLLCAALFCMHAHPVLAQDLRIQADNLMGRADQCYCDGDLWGALERFTQAWTLYKLVPFPLGEIYALDAIGRVSAQLGRYVEAFTAFERAQVICQTQEKPALESKILTHLGMLSSRCGKHLKALLIFRKVLELAQNLGDRFNEGRTWNNIGAVYLNQQWHEDALASFEQALTIAADIADREGEAKAFMNLGTAYRKHKDFAEALDAYHNALLITQEVHNTLEEAAVHLGRGDVHLEIGIQQEDAGDVVLSQESYASALDAFQQALSLYRAENQTLGEATALLNIGKVYLRQARYTEALEDLLQALAIYQAQQKISGQIESLESLLKVYDALDDRFARAETLSDLGALLYQQGDAEQAEKKLFKALSLYYSLDHREGKIRTHALLGKISLERGNCSFALNDLQRALDLMDDSTDAVVQAEVLADIGRAYLAQGDENLAVEKLTEALALYQQADHAAGQADVLLWIGEIARQQGNMTEAHDTFQQALTLQQAAENHDGAAQACLGLGRIALQQDDYPSALDFFQQAQTHAQRASNPYQEAQAWAEIGAVHQLHAQYPEALDPYRKALALFRECEAVDNETLVLEQICALHDLHGSEPVEKVADLIALGKAYRKQQNYPEAFAIFEEAKTAYQTLSDQAGEAEAMRQIGITYQENGQDALADETFQQALQLYRSLSDQIGEASTLEELGHLAFKQLAYAEAKDFYEQALSLYQANGDRAGEGRVLMWIGKVYKELGFPAKAVEIEKEAVLILAEVDDHYNLILALMCMGDAYSAQGLYWDALEAYRRALGIMHDTGRFLYADLLPVPTPQVPQPAPGSPPVPAPTPIYPSVPVPVTPAEIYEEIAEEYANLDRPDDAADALEEATELYDLHGDDEQALDTYEEVQDLQQEMHDSEGEVETLTEMAEILEENGETDAAVECLEEALEHERDQNDYAGQADIVRRIEDVAPDYSDVETAPPDNSDDYANTPAEPSPSPFPGTPSQPSDSPTRSVASRSEPSSEQPVDSSVASSPLLASVPAHSAAPLPIQTHAGRADHSPLADADRLRRKAETLNTVGLVYLRQGQYKNAGQFFWAAQQLQEQIGDEAGKAETLSNQGNLHYMLGQYEEAQALFAESLALMRKHGDRSGEAAALNHLALILSHHGQAYAQARQADKAEQTYQQAIHYFRQAIHFCQHSDEPGAEGSLLNNLGLTYFKLMLLCRDRSERETDPAMALAYSQRAFTLYRMTLRAYDAALRICRDAGRHAGESATLHNIAQAYAALRLDRQALSYFQQALTLERRTGNLLDEARTLSNMAYLYERQGRGLMQTVHPSSHTDSAWALSRWRNLFSNVQGKLYLEQALTLYRASIALQERLRTTARLEEFKISIAEESVDVYQQTVLLLLALDKPEAAFNMAERARSRTFLDQLGNFRLDLHDGASTQLLRQEYVLRKELAHLSQQLREEYDQPLLVDNSDKIDALQAQRTQRQRVYDDIVMQIKLTHPEAAALVSVNPATLGEIQEQLDDDVTLLSYFVTPGTTVAFVVTNSSFKAVSLPLQEDQLREAIFEVRKAAPETAAVPQSLQDLYEWLLAPIAFQLNTATVGIVPHGVLHYLPFAALIDAQPYLGDPSTLWSRQYFGDMHTLFALPSASVLSCVQSPQQTESGQHPFVIGNKGYPPLKHAEQEAREVAGIYHVTPYVGAQATKAHLMASAPSASMLHLSGHAHLNAHSPLSAGIMLYDAPLTIHEIYGLDLHHTELAVLSACNTTLGQQSRGDDIIALHRAFMYAGTPSVVASLWSVDDAATREFMVAFHSALSQGMDNAAALQHAQIETRRNHPHPHYWAAFVLTGDPGKSPTISLNAATQYLRDKHLDNL